MNRIEGDWYDGVSSRARRVAIVRGDDGLLHFDDGDAGARYAPGAIRLGSRLGNTPRVLALPDGSRVECADSPLLDDWFPVHSWIEAWADWLERRRSAILVAALGTIACVVVFFRFGVPWAAMQLAERIPRGVEVASSEQVMAVFRRMGVGDSRLPEARQEALRQRFTMLVAGEPRHRELQLAFAHAPRLGPNAFALPDGRVFMTDALVELADDDELLAVLAHEAGHHVHRHGLRQAIESSSVVVIVGLMLGDASGSSLVASIPSVLLASGFSRGHEREADGYALDLLDRRGIAPEAFTRVMQRLQLAHGPGGEAPGWLSTHPPTPERIRAARNRRSGADAEGAGQDLSPDAP